MPKGVLVLGIGGVGRGIVNNLKWRLEELYGSPHEAGVVLHVMDGPPSDERSEVPGGYQIDVSPGSQEKYQFTSDPSATLQELARGSQIPFISSWLSSQEALNTPRQGIAPNTGFGGIRVPGRICLFREFDTIRRTLYSLIKKTRDYLSGGGIQGFDNRQNKEINIDTITVFICGSQSGGTGAGLLTDVAHITRSYLGTHDRLQGILALPNVFTQFVNNPMHLMANGTAAFREILRSQMDKIPFQVQYDSSLIVKNEQLFHICFLVDGGAFTGGDPRKYLYPAGADMILSYIQDRGSMYNDLANRVVSYQQESQSNRRFSRYGIQEWIYPARDLIQVLSNRFAQEILQYACNKDFNDPFDGSQKAEALLKDFSNFTNMANQLGQKPGPPLTPERNFINLLGQSFDVGKRKARMPKFPSPNLHEEVRRSGIIFNRKTNSRVVANTQSFIEEYLGNPNSTNTNTIFGCLNRQKNVLAQEYGQMLIQQMDNIFFQTTEGELQPKNWAHEQGQLIKAVELLTAIKSKLQALSDHIDDVFRDHGFVGTDAKQISLSQHMFQQMEKIAKDKSFEPHNTDRERQEQYLDLGNKYLLYRLWEILIGASKETTKTLENKTAVLLNKIGPQAGGWLNRLQSHLKEAQDMENKKRSVRNVLAGIRTRKYVPKNEDRVEDPLYEEKVSGPHLDSYLRGCHWYLASQVSEQVQEDNVDNFYIFVETPQAQNFERTSSRKRLRFHHNREHRDYNVHEFTWREIQMYIAEKIEISLRNMSIWELLALDFSNDFQFISDVKDKNLEEQIHTYAEAVCDDLIGNAKQFHCNISTPGSNPFHYCISNFIHIQDPIQLSDKIATQIYRILQQRNIQLVHNDECKHQITLLYLEDHIDSNHWTSLSDCKKQYYEYLQTPRSTIISLFPNEQNAVRLELECSEFYNTHPEWLPVSIVGLLSDMKIFHTIVLGYIFNMFKQENYNWPGFSAPVPSIGLENPQSGDVKWIAPQWKWGNIIYSLMYDTQLQNLRQSLVERWEKHLEESISNSSREQVANMIREKIANLHLPDLPAAFGDRQADFVPHDKLTDAMKAAVRLYLQELVA